MYVQSINYRKKGCLPRMCVSTTMDISVAGIGDLEWKQEAMRLNYRKSGSWSQQAGIHIEFNPLWYLELVAS